MEIMPPIHRIPKSEYPPARDCNCEWLAGCGGFLQLDGHAEPFGIRPPPDTFPGYAVGRASPESA